MLIIQFEMREDVDDDDLEFRHEVEAIARQCLRASGIGDCDGGDLGGGKINVFCTVTDATSGCAAIVEGLVAVGLEDFVIAFLDENHDNSDFAVLWPRDFAGTFSVL